MRSMSGKGSNRRSPTHPIEIICHRPAIFRQCSQRDASPSNDERRMSCDRWPSFCESVPSHARGVVIFTRDNQATRSRRRPPRRPVRRPGLIRINDRDCREAHGSNDALHGRHYHLHLGPPASRFLRRPQFFTPNAAPRSSRSMALIAAGGRIEGELEMKVISPTRP